MNPGIFENMIAIEIQGADGEIRPPQGFIVTWGLIRVDFVIPLVAPVLEIRQHEMQRNRGMLAHLVIQRARSAPAQPVIAVLAQRNLVEIRYGGSIRVEDRVGLNVVNAATVVVILGTPDQAPALGRPEAHSGGCVHFADVTGIQNRRIAHGCFNTEIRLHTRRFGDEIHRPADAIRILIGGEGLVQLDGLHHVIRDCRQIYLTNRHFGSRNSYTVNRDIGKPRIKSANLNIYAFAFIPL